VAALPDECRSAFMLTQPDATSDRGVAAAADLAEALAAEAALGSAGMQACDALIRGKAAEEQQK